MNRLLIIGSGDVALRAMPWLRRHFQVWALLRASGDAARWHEAGARWHEAGARVIRADLDCRASLRRLAGLASHVLYCAPPSEQGQDDLRMARLLAALGRGRTPRSVVYISTSGVYGDCAGAQVAEHRPVAPASARARRRLAAETRLRAAAIGRGFALRILRAPGIYAAARLPLARLQSGAPVLCAADDVFTNHIHAGDLARAACLALWRGPQLRVWNVCDDTHLRMGEFYDLLAAQFGLPPPPRASRAECAQQLSPLSLSFMSESRRLLNARIRRELRWAPRFAQLAAGLAAARAGRDE